MKRTLSILLLLLTAAGIVSCGGEGGKTTETTQTDAATDAAAVTETTEPEIRDNVPDLDYGGDTVTLFIRTEDPSKPEFYVEEETGDIVADAIYQRNLAVAERLNINFAFAENQCDYSTRTSWPKIITQNIMAGDGAFDIAAGYSMAMANLATAGMLLDMLGTAHLDFTQPWWSDSLMNESLIKGKLYFASGDISTWMILYTYGMIFNKSMLKNYDLEDPYALALDGKWTLDKMMDMSKGLYKDLNGNAKADVEDQFGYASSSIFSDAFFFSSGLKTTAITDDGVVMSEDFSGEKAVSLIDKLTQFINVSDDACHTNIVGEDNYNFDRGNTLFANIEIQYAYTTLREVDFEYGILPLPKYDEAQENYHTVTSFGQTLYGIPLDARDPDMSSAVMECLASESYKRVVPALFEVALKVKYSMDTEDAKMYDILRSGVVFDLGRIFNDSLGAETYSLFRNALLENTNTWASTCAKRVPALDKKLEKLFEKFE